MRRISLFFAVALSSFVAANSVAADILFESGTLGSTGVTWDDLSSQAVPGTNVKDSVFAGVRFHLDQPVTTSQIGGHFVGASPGTFFGAVIVLDNANDFPDSLDLSSADVLGSTLLSFPIPSDEIFGKLTLSLDPGWYALVFGSGRFQATANGGAVRNGSDIDTPTYIVGFPAGTGWHDLTFSLPNHRFVLKGRIVPEASSTIQVFVALLCLLFQTRGTPGPPILGRQTAGWHFD